MKDITAIIFDLDGVICSTDEYHYRAWKQLADQWNIPFGRTVNNRLRGVSRMESLEIVLEKYHGPALSRKQKDSHNRGKQRLRVARVHEKIANQRNDFLQKQSTMLVRENQTICIEDLNVKGMIRNHKLAKSIASVSWAKFFEMLEYKASWYGNELHRVPTMYPSSQTCSSCGYRNPRIKNLSIRIWECPKCHAVHDRDTNAGINILKKALQMQSA